MTITRYVAGTAGTAGSSTTATVTWSVNPPAGAKVLVYVLTGAAATVNSVKDNGTSQTTFTRDVSAGATSGNVTAYIYRGDGISLPGAGSYTVTVTLAANNSIVIFGSAYTGVASGAPSSSNSSFQSSATSSVTTGAVTPPSIGSLCFAAFGDDTTSSSESITLTWQGANTLFTESNGSSFDAGSGADLITVSTQSQTGTWTLGDSVINAGCIAAYAPLGTYQAAVPRVARPRIQLPRRGGRVYSNPGGPLIQNPYTATAALTAYTTMFPVDPAFLAVGSGGGGYGHLTSFTITPNGVGHLILLWVYATGTKTVHATGISSSNVTWTQIGTTFLGSTANGTGTLWAGRVTSVSTATVSITWSGAGPATLYAFQEFSVTTGSWALDVQGNLDSTGTANWPSLTPAAAGELYAGFAANNTNAVAGSTSGYFYNANQDTFGDGLAYNQNVGVSATNPVWGDSGQQFGIMVLMKATGGSGTAGTASLAAATTMFASTVVTGGSGSGGSGSGGGGAGGGGTPGGPYDPNAVNSNGIDTYNAYNPLTGAYTAPLNGLYLVFADFPFTANSTGVRYAGFEISTENP